MDIQESFERDLLDLVRKYVAERENYWRDWNGRAANRAAELEARIKKLEDDAKKGGE